MDEKITLKIQEWLDTPVSERNISEGAELMLKLNRNRVLYQNVVRRGAKMMGKIEYELKKFLRLRLDNKTVADVVRMQKEIVPRVEETLLVNEGRALKDSEHSGKRADHDELPPEIQALWDDNFGLYAKIKELFEELKSMNKLQPCDRYEVLQVLDEIDKKYRRNLAEYDAFVLSAAPEQQPVDAAELANKIGSARKYLSDNKTKLAKLIEGGQAEKADALRSKMAERVSILQQAGAAISDEQLTELSSLGVL